MKRLILSIGFVLGLCLTAYAGSMTLLGAGLAGAAPPAGYQGPGDVQGSSGGWYSCGFAYTAAYATGAGNLCLIADVGTGTITCTMKAATNGSADLTSALCAAGTLTVPAFCTAHTSCVVKTAYDQSASSRDVTNATLSQMPVLTFSALAGAPCMTGLSTNSTGLIGPSTAYPSPWSGSIVTKVTNTGAFGGLLALGSFGIGSSSSTNVWQMGGGTSLGMTATDGVYHAGQMLLATSSGAAYQIGGNSPTTGQNVGTASGTNTIRVFTRGGTSASATICEAGYWPSDTSANWTALYANQQTRYSGGGL